MSRLSAEELYKISVKIEIPEERVRSSGFFVCPGLILTCGHMLNNHKTERVKVLCKRKKSEVEEFEATVNALPKDLSVDVAMLRCLTPISIHPYGYLDRAIQVDDCLRCYGYSQDYPDGALEKYDYDGDIDEVPTLMKLRGGIVKTGLSGAPLLNDKTGKICGVLKETRSETIPLGGGGVSVSFVIKEWKNLVENPAVIDLILKMKAIEEVDLISRNINNSTILTTNNYSCDNLLKSIKTWLGKVHSKLSYPKDEEINNIVNAMERIDSRFLDSEALSFFNERGSLKLELMKKFIITRDYKYPPIKHCIPMFLYLCTNNIKFLDYVCSYSEKDSRLFHDYVRYFLMQKLIDLYQ